MKASEPMSRCIICGKLIAKGWKYGSVDYHGESFDVCCPMCEKEFYGNPRLHTAVARSVLDGGDNEGAMISEESAEAGPHLNFDMLRSMRDSFEEIRRTCDDLKRDFEQISASGGLEGLRRALHEHHGRLEALQDKAIIHAGVCQFIVRAAESTSAHRD